MSKRQQMNLGFYQGNEDEFGVFNNHPPLVVKIYQQQAGEGPNAVNKQQRYLGLDSSNFENYPSRNLAKKSRNKEESKLKSFYADHLMDLIAKEDLNLKVASYRTNISFMKLLELAKGKIGQVSLYDLLHAITAFGCDARICLRPTTHQSRGEVMPDY